MWTDDSPMPFGKHKGKQLKDVPAAYLLWWDSENGDYLDWPQLRSYIELNRDDLEERADDERMDEEISGNEFWSRDD